MLPLLPHKGRRQRTITLSEMAGWFGISPSEAKDIVVQGHIPYARVNGEVHVYERALNAWIEQQFNFPARAPHAVKFGNLLPINEKEDYDDGRESFVFGR